MKRRGRPTKATRDEADERVDVHVGARLRLRRTLLGMSQEQVAKAIGLTFQQLQKYERGCNRISAGKLFELSFVLDVPISCFFDGIDNDGPVPSEDSDLMRREVLELARAFAAIQSEKLRRNVLDLVRAVGAD